jgi:hypothetical protein
MSINQCDICYTMVANPCEDTYEIPTGLTGNITYTMVLEDHHGNLYISDANQPTVQPGNPVTISISSFDKGMFNQWSGSYEIWFTDGGIDGNQQTLTIGGKEYPCVLMTFKDVTIV